MAPAAAGDDGEREAGLRGKFARHLVEPYVRHITRCPHTICSGTALLIFVVAMVSILSGCMTPEDEDDFWLVMDGESTLFYKAWQSAKGQALDKSVGDARRLDSHLGFTPPAGKEDGGFVETQFGNAEWWSLTLFYKSDKEGSGNVFTPQRLQEMCRLEALVVKRPMTWATNSDSAAQLFYRGRQEAASCAELDQSVVDAQLQVMSADVAANGTSSSYARLVSGSFVGSGQSPYSRTRMQVSGGPSITDQDHKKEVMEEIVLADLGASYGFGKSALEGEEDQFLPSGPLRVRLFYRYIERFLTFMDLLMSVAAVVVVFWLIYLYLNSAFLAGVAMFQIVLSLPVAAILYRYLFQVKYFDQIHILMIYLVLGIGADDVFVLVDSFRHFSEEAPAKPGCRYNEEQLAYVLKHTLLRSAQAIFNTSFTTMVAFLSQSVSGIMPMRTCGYFAALCIVMNYLLTMFFFPSALVVYHRRFEGKRCCCPSPGTRVVHPSDSDGRLEDRATVADDGEKLCPRSGGMSGCIEGLFLERFYIPLMRKKVGPVRVAALAVTVGMIAVACQGAYFTSRLTPPTKPEVWMPESHMHVGVAEFWSENFYEADYERNAVVTFTWGISGADKTDFDQYRPSLHPPQATFEPAFDVTTAEAQAEILDVCEKMQTLQCQLEGCTGQGSTFMFSSSQKAYSCFLEDMKQHLEDKGESLPTGPAFITELQKFVDLSSSNYSSEVCRADYAYDVGFIGGQLKYVSVKLRTRLSDKAAYAQAIEVKDLIQAFVDGRRASAPAELRSMGFHADGAFARLDISTELIKGLISGISIAFPLAFIVLLTSTGNVVVSFYAVCCVGGVVVCVLGFCKSAMGWDLGIGEAISGVIVIGYSVDYVVHLAHIYCEASRHGHRTRDARATFAVRNMGSTVFAGALTTAGSGSVMFLCYLRFFFKMAVLISVTIMFSLLFSMGLFMGLLWLIGPEGNFGDICCWPAGKVPPPTTDMPSEVEAPEVEDASSLCDAPDCTPAVPEGARPGSAPIAL